MTGYLSQALKEIRYNVNIAYVVLNGIGGRGGGESEMMISLNIDEVKKIPRGQGL